jgi:hypothetical protein
MSIVLASASTVAERARSYNKGTVHRTATRNG